MSVPPRLLRKARTVFVLALSASVLPSCRLVSYRFVCLSSSEALLPPASSNSRSAARSVSRSSSRTAWALCGRSARSAASIETMSASRRGGTSWRNRDVGSRWVGSPPAEARAPAKSSGGQRAARAFQPRGRRAGQRRRRRVHRRGEVAAGQFRLGRVLPAHQPVPRGVDVIGGCPATPRSGPGVTSAHQATAASLEAGARTREVISAPGPGPPAGPRAQQRGGQAQLGGHCGHRGGVAVGQRPGDGDRLGGRTSCCLQPGLDQVDDVVRSADRLASVSFLALPFSR
jgi:hypothetical protein